MVVGDKYLRNFFREIYKWEIGFFLWDYFLIFKLVIVDEDE